jgi:hypothetical protein
MHRHPVQKTTGPRLPTDYSLAADHKPRASKSPNRATDEVCMEHQRKQHITRVRAQPAKEAPERDQRIAAPAKRHPWYARKGKFSLQPAAAGSKSQHHGIKSLAI